MLFFFSKIVDSLVERQREIDEAKEAEFNKAIQVDGNTGGGVVSGDEQRKSKGDKRPKIDRQKSSAIPYVPLEVPNYVWDDVTNQVSSTASPDVLSNTSEIVIQYGYIMLFCFVFPAMPLFALINNFFEVRVDLYNLINCRRPIPYGASGIGVWKACISLFGTVAVFSNMALVVFRTDLIKDFVDDDSTVVQITFFFISSFVLLFCMFIVRFSVPDLDQRTADALERQEVKYARITMTI